MIILHFHLQPQFKNELFHIYFTSILILLSVALDAVKGVNCKGKFATSKERLFEALSTNGGSIVLQFAVIIPSM